MNKVKTCFCHRCQKFFHPYGIMSHLAMHKRKGEEYRVTYTNGNIREWKPKKKKENENDK